MTTDIQFILSLSIVFAFVIGIVRFRKVDPTYYPFLYYVALAFTVEIIHRILFVNNHKNLQAPLIHVYSYIEFCLFAWLFHNWGLFNRRKDVFLGILGAFFVCWCISSFYIHGFKVMNSSFLTLSSFALIFFSVNTFNRVVVHERGNIFRSPKFLICLGVIIFYTFFVLINVTALSMFRQTVSVGFRSSLHQINVYSNFLVNLLYAVAVLWIPRKQPFTTPFSLL